MKRSAWSFALKDRIPVKVLMSFVSVAVICLRCFTIFVESNIDQFSITTIAFNPEKLGLKVDAPNLVGGSAGRITGI